MNFTRSFLKSAGLTDEQISAVMEEHNRVVTELKQQRDDLKADVDKYKADAEKLPELQTQLKNLRDGDYEAKYNKEHADFTAYRQQIADGEALAQKKAAYRKLLSDTGISEKRLDSVIRLTDFETIKLNKDGGLSDADRLKETIRQEWGEYIVTKAQNGADVGTPPASSGDGFAALPLDKKMAYANQHPNAPEVTAWLKS